MFAGYFYGNYSITGTTLTNTKSGISRYGYYNAQGTFYGFNRNFLLSPNYGYGAYYEATLDANGAKDFSALNNGFWRH